MAIICLKISAEKVKRKGRDREKEKRGKKINNVVNRSHLSTEKIGQEDELQHPRWRYTKNAYAHNMKGQDIGHFVESIVLENLECPGGGKYLKWQFSVDSSGDSDKND